MPLFSATDPAIPVARALVVVPMRDGDTRDPDARLEEAVGLTRGLGIAVAHARTVALPEIKAASLFDRKGMERLGGMMEAFHADLLVVDHCLTSLQQRSLERACLAKAIDRPTLILESLWAHADDATERMQAELAALQHQRGRKLRCWIRLGERLDGPLDGFGFQARPGGVPGDTLLERHRRLLTERIATLKRELTELRRAAARDRAERRAAGIPSVALIGYAGSGVSTLRARLAATPAATPAAFGRSVALAEGLPVLDDLPHGTVRAFGAALDAVRDADLILHVRDAADPQGTARAATVEGLLGDLGIDPATDRRLITVLNKADRLSGLTRAALGLRVADEGGGRTVLVSATRATGVAELRELIDCHLPVAAPMALRADGPALA